MAACASPADLITTFLLGRTRVFSATISVSPRGGCAMPEAPPAGSAARSPTCGKYEVVEKKVLLLRAAAPVRFLVAPAGAWS